MFERFDRARKPMDLARREAVRRNHDFIGPEHVLLGILRLSQASESVAGKVLAKRGVDVEALERRIDEGLGSGSQQMVVPQQVPYLFGVKQVLDMAVEEATKLGHDYVGTEHLLLGFLRERESLAAKALCDSGLDLETTRRDVAEAASQGNEEE
jgi:ATP-dependent Clp protease ATP-binding subunit ClpC